MSNFIGIRCKKVIYKGEELLLPDLFDEIFNFKGYMIAYNHDKLVIVDSEGEKKVEEEGIVEQVAGFGKCISIKKPDGKMGVFLYDGTILVPFNYSSVFISDADNFEFDVKEQESDSWKRFIGCY